MGASDRLADTLYKLEKLLTSWEKKQSKVVPFSLYNFDILDLTIKKFS